MDKRWVEQTLERLATDLRSYVPLASVREFEPAPSLYDNLFRAADLNSAVKELCSHVGLGFASKIEVVGDSKDPVLDLEGGRQFFEKQIDSAGDYTSGHGLLPTIGVGASHFRRPHKLGHILAHEISHHFLNSKMIVPSHKDENEMLTDLTAVYLGYGKLVINGAADESPESVQRPVYVTDRGVPYVGYPLLAYAYCICQGRRGIAGSALYRNLKQPCATMVRAFARREGRSGLWIRMLEGLGAIPSLPDTDGAAIVADAWRLNPDLHRIVKCVGCDGNLRIPKKESTLKVTCPTCRKTFEVGTRTG